MLKHGAILKSLREWASSWDFHEFIVVKIEAFESDIPLNVGTEAKEAFIGNVIAWQVQLFNPFRLLQNGHKSLYELILQVISAEA